MRDSETEMLNPMKEESDHIGSVAGSLKPGSIAVFDDKTVLGEGAGHIDKSRDGVMVQFPQGNLGQSASGIPTLDMNLGQPPRRTLA